jgi:hypothetical protein
MTILHTARERWARLSPVAKWRLVLGLVGAALAVWLLLADKPWSVLPGTRLKIRHLVTIYTWWGGLFALTVTASLALLCPWWASGRPSGRPAQSQPAPGWFWPMILSAMILGAILAYPRLDHSLWDDEELCVRDSLAGKFRVDEKSGQPRFFFLKWQDTIFGYDTPNNHVLHSLLARASNEAALALSGPRELPFSESALRLPAYVFGILAIGALGWFLLDAGFPAAGALAAFLLAIHPWQIRYASEARGYSLIMLLVSVLFVCWRRAVTLGTWKWWAACAAVQFALLYTYPGMLFLLLTINLLTLPALAFSRESPGPFREQSGRWFVANACAAAVTVILMLPLVPQARIYFDHESSRQIELGWPWIRSTLSFLLAGVSWASSADHVALSQLAEVHPWVLAGFVASLLVLLAAGTIVFASRSRLHACIAAVILLTPILTILLSRARKMMIYESYIIYALPGLVALAAVGAAAAARGLSRWPGGRITGPAFCAGLVLLYAAATHTFRDWIITHPLQQIRESVLACRPGLDPADPRQQDILTASFCIPPYLYDAHMTRADSADEFIALLAEADQTGKTLFVNIGMPWAAEEYSPRMWAMFTDDRLFGERQQFLGLDAGLNRLVARYKPGSAAGYDFSALRGAER